jgi:hypothetical protein
MNIKELQQSELWLHYYWMRAVSSVLDRLLHELTYFKEVALNVLNRTEKNECNIRN